MCPVFFLPRVDENRHGMLDLEAQKFRRGSFVGSLEKKVLFRD